jgi:hypothetical protein
MNTSHDLKGTLSLEILTLVWPAAWLNMQAYHNGLYQGLTRIKLVELLVEQGVEVVMRLLTCAS